MRALGILASTNFGGAGGWQRELAAYFAGKSVVLIPDADAPGERWASKMLEDLRGSARALKRIALPGVVPGSGGDITDWLAARHTKGELLALVESARDLLNEDGSALVRDVETFYERFLVLPPGALLPLALWTVATHLFKSFETYPYLTFISPGKRCGKTRATEALELLAAKSARSVCVREASLFRLIEKEKPTLIIDESEVLMGKGERAEAVRALLNAGNRVGVFVTRCTGSSHELRSFAVYCPKVICAIRACPDTITDRSIVISMQRKKPSEKVARFLSRRVRPDAESLRGRIAAFACANRDAIERAYQELDADFLTDRDLECFEPLIATLAVADPSRLEELQKAAERLTSGKTRAGVDESLGLRLLADLRAVWPLGERNALTSDLLTRLRGIEESPWAGEVELTPRRLANLLRPFEVWPATVRVGESRAKGYVWEDVQNVFPRYL